VPGIVLDAADLDQNGKPAELQDFAMFVRYRAGYDVPGLRG